jgi:hypothetical protein
LDGYFHSPEFTANPVGVTYDPEQLARDYEAGGPIADLLRIPPPVASQVPVFLELFSVRLLGVLDA